MRNQTIAAAALLMFLGSCARAQTYGFVAVLGNDTTSLERVTRGWRKTNCCAWFMASSPDVRGDAPSLEL